MLHKPAVPNCLSGGLKGIEKEGLRVSFDGSLSQRMHPISLGSALSNSYITTDFSEALLEFVTPAYESTWEALTFLCDLHQFTYERIDDEQIWATSMPCAISEDSEIPLAQYGTSNVGRMKTVYRNGLSYRYGRLMQSIAGIHYNYSLPRAFWPTYQAIEQNDGNADDFRSTAYLGLVRNVRRFGWIILYLFGASPALCKSFSSDLNLPSFNADTYYQPFATSLRMSDLGYSNSAQADINISLNSIDEYIADLVSAISTPNPDYEKIGIKVDGEYRQLNANQLQIENEYYSAVRPKRVAHSGERPTAALQRGGIEYVEIRSLDINIFDPVGISQNTMRFVEAFLIYCLLEDSPLFNADQCEEAAYNHALTASEGRKPGLTLHRDGKEIELHIWANEILDNVAQVAEFVDQGCDRNDYADSISLQRALVLDADATPSARILRDLRESGVGFSSYALEATRNHRQYFAELQSLSKNRLDLLANEVSNSIVRQAEIENADDISLDEYLKNYFSS